MELIFVENYTHAQHSEFAGAIFAEIFILRNLRNIHPSKITRYTVEEFITTYIQYMCNIQYIYMYTINQNGPQLLLHTKIEGEMTNNFKVDLD